MNTVFFKMMVPIFGLSQPGPISLATRKLQASWSIPGTLPSAREFENELRCHAEEIKDLYNNAPCGYHSLDKDGTFIQINDTLLNWLGYSRDEIIGKKKLGDLLTRDEIQKFQRNFPVLKKEGKLRNLECEFVRKDGSILPLLLNSTAVKVSSGGYISNRSSTFDISERKIMEEMLLKSEARFRALVQNSSDVFMILEADGTYRYVNLSSERIMGYKPEELIGKKPMDFVHPDDLEKFLQAFGKCVASLVIPVLFNTVSSNRTGHLYGLNLSAPIRSMTSTSRAL